MRMLTVLLVGLSSVALAQAPQPALDAFLEQRVVEELASDGLALSRLGVSLDVELVGDKLLVSLVDPATQRVVASTKVDTIPVDREAAVAQVTQVVGDLATQLGHAPRPTPTPPPRTDEGGGAPGDSSVVDELRRDRDLRAAERDYEEEALGFGDEIAVAVGPRTTTVMSVRYAYQGTMKRRLSVPEFFELVERPDLAATFKRRRLGGMIGMIGGSAAFLVGSYVGAKASEPYERALCFSGDFTMQQACERREDEKERAYDDDRHPKRIVGWTLAAGGAVVAIASIFFWYRANPLSEREVYDLAADHNAKLRKKHGLPVSLAPYADERGGGMLVSGRF